MRVLIVGINFAPEPTGVAPYTTGLATRLAESGHAVRVLTAFPHYPTWHFPSGTPHWASDENLAGVRVHRVRHLLPLHPGGAMRILSELVFGMRLIGARWGKPDVVLFVTPALFSVALAMLKARIARNRVPVGVWVQDLYGLGMHEAHESGEASIAARVVTAVEGRTLQAADGVIVIHDHFGESVHELGVAPERCTVIRNWSHVHAETDTDIPAVRARHGWRADETVVLHAGNLGVKQDLHNVVEAARLADARREPVRFVLLGGGGERDALRAAGGGIERLQFIDPLPDDDFMAALQASDVLLVNEHPRVRGMSVPSKLTSYFAAGRPVIAATHEQSLTAQELSAAMAGVRVDPGEPAQLLEAALGLGRASEASAILGASGQEYRRRVLSEEAAVAAFEHWFEQLSGRKVPVVAHSLVA